jgi:hypothetical protein
VAGGWSTLAGLLAGRAARLGVQIRTRARVSAVPAGPTILATSLAAACSPREHRHAGWAMTTATLRPATMAGWAVTGELERAQPSRSGG